MALPDLELITDERELQKMLDNATDFEERRALRDRLREVKADNKKERDDRLRKISMAREEMFRYKAEQEEDSKLRYMQIYENNKFVHALNTNYYTKGTCITPDKSPLKFIHRYK